MHSILGDETLMDLSRHVTTLPNNMDAHESGVQVNLSIK